MRNINYKSDFLLIQHIYVKDRRTGEIKDIGFPEWDFSIVYYTSSSMKTYEVSCHSGRCRNCRNENGRLLVIFDNHGLGCSELKGELTLEIPEDIFPDGDLREVLPVKTDTRLWEGPSDGYGMAEAEVILPFIKGEPFTFEDLTDQQIDELAGKAAGKVLDEAGEDLKERIDEIKNNIEEEIQKDLVDAEDYTEEDLMGAISSVGSDEVENQS